MKKITKLFLLLIIGFYWLNTILYNSPNNYIKIKFENEQKIFGLFFEQKWNFFAPPPQQNDKLYFTYLDADKNEIAVFEIFSSLIKAKRDTKPFNSRAEMIDYTISGSIISIINDVISARENEKLRHPNFNLKKLDSIARQKIVDNSENISGYLLLKNYSKAVGRQYLTAKQLGYVKYIKIKINSKPIKKFSERNNPKPDLEYNLIDFKQYPFNEENFILK